MFGDQTLFVFSEFAGIELLTGSNQSHETTEFWKAIRK
jgi:hypothetical protein